MKIQDIKQQLNRVFDDNLHTRQWENYVDYAIIGLIVVSTLQIYLSTFDYMDQHFGALLKWVDYVTIAAFTIEVTLRIWCADLLDEKYSGFWGRVKYCCSFYGFIDFVSTYSFYVALFFPIPYNILKVFRIARLLRIFRYMTAFTILHMAFSSKKKEMVVSLQFLGIVTLILSFILFFVEHEAQPEVYENGWTSVLWAFAQYIGDPGGFADTPPITVTGRLIACIIGVLGIAIFAVPAGLIASGFSDAMADMQRDEELETCRQRLRVLFRRTDTTKGSQVYLASQPDGDVISKYKFIESRQPIVRLQVRQHFDLKDIMDTVERSPEFLLKTMSTAISADNEPEERLILEHYIVNRSYGCFINRKSDLTIVSTSNFVEIGTFWFMYYVAKLGGFNFISKHVEVDPDDKTDSFCNFRKEPIYHYMKRAELEKDRKKNREALEVLDKKDRQRKEFLEDLQICCEQCDHPWMMLGIWHIKSATNTEDFHFSIHNKKGDKCTLTDTEKFNAFISQFTQRMSDDFEFSTTGSKQYDLFNNNIIFRVQEQPWGKNVNGFSLRPSSDILCFNTRKSAIAFAMADTLRTCISEGNRQTPEERKADIDGFKEGIGYPEQMVDEIEL